MHTWNHHPSIINLLYLPRFIASSVLNPRALQSLCMTSVQVSQHQNGKPFRENGKPFRVLMKQEMMRWHHHHHHHHRVARPWQDIAVSLSLRHLERSCARFQAELIPRLCCWRSSSIVRSQVRLGRPGGRCQSTGSRLMAARRAREWSWDGSSSNIHRHMSAMVFTVGLSSREA